MRKEIKLIYNIGKYVEGAKYIDIGENLEFILNYEKPVGSKLYFCASNGSLVKKGLIENNIFVLNCNFIKLGKLDIKIEVEFLGNIIKTFTVEPLIIQKLEEQIQTIPEILELENNINKLNKKVEELNNRLDFFIKMWKEGI